MIQNNMLPKTIIRAGERYYAGGTVPTIAKRDIKLPLWDMFEVSPEPEQPEPLNSMATAFLAQPERTGGVTGDLSF